MKKSMPSILLNDKTISPPVSCESHPFPLLSRGTVERKRSSDKPRSTKHQESFCQTQGLSDVHSIGMQERAAPDPPPSAPVRDVICGVRKQPRASAHSRAPIWNVWSAAGECARVESSPGHKAWIPNWPTGHSTPNVRAPEFGSTSYRHDAGPMPRRCNNLVGEYAVVVTLQNTIRPMRNRAISVPPFRRR